MEFRGFNGQVYLISSITFIKDLRAMIFFSDDYGKPTWVELSRKEFLDRCSVALTKNDGDGSNAK